MWPYILLILTLVLSAVAAAILKASDGLTRPFLSVLGIALQLIDYVLFSRVILYINISVAYAVFMAVISVTVLHLELTRPDIIGITIIVIGVICMDMWGVKEAPAKKEPDEPEENSQT